MSIDQIELFFQLLILQNSDRKVIDVFPSYNGKETTFGQCEILKEMYGINSKHDFAEILSLLSLSSGRSIVRFRIIFVDSNIFKRDFITWKEGKPIENEFEPFYKHLLNFVSFEDKV